MANMQEKKRNILKDALRSVTAAGETATALYGAVKSNRQRRNLQDKFAEKAYAYAAPYLSGSDQKNVYNTVKGYTSNDKFKEARNYIEEQLKKIRKQMENEPDAVKAGIINRIQKFDKWEDL